MLRKKEQAREHHKKFGPKQARGDGTALLGPARHSHRLRKNRDSAAAARHALAAYRESLERRVTDAEMEQSMLSLEAANMRARRDELAAEVICLGDTLASMRNGTGSSDELALIAEFDIVCSTPRLLDALKHIPRFNMSPDEFAVSLIISPTCPAL